MPLSLESIRRLNKAKFLVECCTDPMEKIDSSSGIWTFSHYSDGSLGFGAGTQQNAFFANLLKNAPSFVNIMKTVANVGGGIVPQLDIARKFLYQGSDPLSFQIKLYLVLETDPETDFLDPLARLAYLTYPHRFGGASELYDMFVSAVRQLGEWLEKGGEALGFNWSDNFLYRGSDMLASKSGSVASAEEVVNRYIGKVWLLQTPPTFSLMQGAMAGSSGVSVRYGSMLISDIFFKRMSIQVPTLYYEGGYAPYIEVTLDVETLRVASYDMLLAAFKGMVDDSMVGASRFTRNGAWGDVLGTGSQATEF